MASYSRGKDAVRVGATAIVAGSAFLSLFGYSTNRSLTGDHSDLLVRLESAEGLMKGDPVLYRGVQVGEVRGLKFEESGAVLVETRLTQTVPLKRGSSAELVAIDIFGRQSVVLRDGGLDGEAVEDGDTIGGGRAPALTDRVEALSEQAAKFLDPRTIERVNGTLAGVDGTTRELAQFVRTATELLSGQREALDAATASAATIAENIASATDPESLGRVREDIQLAAGRLAALTARLDTTTVSAARILERLESGDGTAARLLNDPAMYEGVVAALASLDALLRDVKQNPKRYFNVSVF